nr:Chain I, Cytochrome b-c1 complex subunit Rieske, mitochondrial [Bos taurus]6FO2_V Chain V, Cytochrome b-c1 complex subunit Rieske, mitochondrial [Bos taurus]
RPVVASVSLNVPASVR